MESRLTFIEKTANAKGLFQCNCGNKKEINIRNVRIGVTKSCGCIGREFPSHTKHGLSDHPLGYIWSTMKARCYNINNQKYPRYGGRGVKVCDEWLKDFKAFYDWAMSNEWKPGLQIDKDIKGNGLLYSPDTCIFVTNKVNCNMRSHTRLVTRNGETKSVMQWCEDFKLNQSTLYSRLKTGWDFELALTTPKQNTNRRFAR